MAEDPKVRIQEGEEAVRRTIVGGRPQAHSGRHIEVPIGIERVLLRAATEPAFRRALATDRAGALATMHTALSPTEGAVLRTVSAAQLDAMIQGIDYKRHSKGGLLRAVAAATFSAAALTACAPAEQVPAPPPPEAQHSVEIAAEAPEDVTAPPPTPAVIAGEEGAPEAAAETGAEGAAAAPSGEEGESSPEVGNEPEEAPATDPEVVEPVKIPIRQDKPVSRGISPDRPRSRSLD